MTKYRMKINGISYPVSERFKRLMERRRKEYSEKMGVKINQATFTELVAKGKIKL